MASGVDVVVGPTPAAVVGEECAICLMPLEQTDRTAHHVARGILHVFHHACLQGYHVAQIASSLSLSCPLCRAIFNNLGTASEGVPGVVRHTSAVLPADPEELDRDSITEEMNGIGDADVADADPVHRDFNIQETDDSGDSDSENEGDFYINHDSR